MSVEEEQWLNGKRFGSWLVGKKQRSGKSSVTEEAPPSTSKNGARRVLNVHGEETYEDAVKLRRGTEEPHERAVGHACEEWLAI